MTSCAFERQRRGQRRVAGQQWSRMRDAARRAPRLSRVQGNVQPPDDVQRRIAALKALSTGQAEAEGVSVRFRRTTSPSDET